MKVRKRCARCGWRGTVSTQQMFCAERRFGPGSAACHGDLVPVVRLPRPADGTAFTERLAELGLVRDGRLRARDQMAQAQRKVDHWVKVVAADVAKLKAWQQKAARYAKQAALTDAEVRAASERGRRAMAAKGTKRIRRAIMVGGQHGAE